VLIVRRLVDRHILGDHDTVTTAQRQWSHSNRTVSMAIMLVGVFLIWLPSLSGVALSLSAFAVAIAITLKELIVCLTGTWYCAVSKPFRVGDWIEVGGFRGEIIDFGLLSTKLLELNAPPAHYSYTGNMIKIPNMWFLTERVVNMTHQRKFVFHAFTITLGTIDVISPQVSQIQTIISNAMAPHASGVGQHLHQARQFYRTDIRLPSPQVQVRTTDYSHLQYYITLCCPTAEALRLEQTIVEAVIKLHYSVKPLNYVTKPGSPC
jgi:small-conductance mechanosensitive channel